MGKRGRKKRARKKNAANHGKRPNAQALGRFIEECPKKQSIHLSEDDPLARRTVFR